MVVVKSLSTLLGVVLEVVVGEEVVEMVRKRRCGF